MAQLGRRLFQIPGPVAHLGKELQAVAEIAGDDVEVGVHDRLAGGFEIIHADIETLGIKGGPQGPGHPAAHQPHLPPEVVGQLQQGGIMLLGNDQGVAVVHRGHIEEGQDPGGLQDPRRRGLAEGDPAEDAVWHGVPLSFEFRVLSFE